MKNSIKTTTITGCIASVFVVFVLSHSVVASPRATTINDDFVEQTCKRTPYPAICLSTLRSDPRSSTANPKTLALIMVEAVNSKAKETLHRVEELLLKRSEQHEMLRNCADIYKAVVEADVPEAIEGVTKGNYKFAEQGMTDAANEARSCEGEFSPGNSPLTDFNDVVHGMATVASSLATMLMAA